MKLAMRVNAISSIREQNWARLCTTKLTGVLDFLMRTNLRAAEYNIAAKRGEKRAWRARLPPLEREPETA